MTAITARANVVMQVERHQLDRTFAIIQPTGPGNLEFYCSVHTHRERGMVGAISVE